MAVVWYNDSLVYFFVVADDVASYTEGYNTRYNGGSCLILLFFEFTKGWSDMKRLLLVLLVLGLSVPAIADVFVYNFKQSGVELAYNADTDAWVQSKPGHTTYVVVQVDSNSPDSVNIWSIDTWKEKDTDEDDKPITIKYYTVDGPSTVSFLQTPIAKKNVWIVEGTLDDSTRLMLSGQSKSTKIGTTKYIVAATLSGYSIYGSIDEEDLVGGTISLTLNSTITKVLVSSDDDVDGAISDYFENTLGYTQG